MDSKTEPASEAERIERQALTRLKAEFSSVRNTFSEMNKKLMDDIIELKAELESERELRKELTAMLNTCHKSLRTYGEHPLIDSWVNNLIKKAKN